MRRIFFALILLCGVSFFNFVSAASEPVTLFKNVRIFDGKSASLTPARQVLIRGNRIEQIAVGEITVEISEYDTVIEGAGRTLMPGLIDSHVHLAMSDISMPRLMTGDANYATLVSAKAAERMLLRGFTSARDASGPVFGLKQAIDEGVVPGPRIWPSGPMISQTSGHGDFRTLHDIPAAENDLHFTERLGYAAIADGQAQVLRRVREQLMQGASQIKLAAGGGVSSFYDPIDVAQYTESELRAAVEAAEAWGTYVMVHAYTPKAIKIAIQAGVKNIEHGQLANEEAIRLMAEKGIWLGIQPFLGDPDPHFPEGSAGYLKKQMVATGTDNAIKLAKKHKVRLAWGTDILFSANEAKAQNDRLAVMQRWFKPSEVMRLATSTNAELLALSGPRNPYPGKLGVVEEGALADLLLVDGNPLENIELIKNPERNFVVIMKDGRIYKNSL